MAVVGHLHKVTWGGKLATTETWSCGLHFLNPDPGNLVLSGLMAGAISQWFLRPTGLMSSNATLEWIKGNELNPLAVPSSKPGAPPSKPYTRYLDSGNSNVYFWISPPSAGTWTPGDPQSTMAVSTTTAKARGRASKGRFYQPTGRMNIDAAGKVSAADTTAMATSAAQLITDLNGSNMGSCVVFSVVGQVTTEITGVRVGNVVDTQRRRRRNLVESYISKPVS